MPVSVIVGSSERNALFRAFYSWPEKNTFRRDDGLKRVEEVHQLKENIFVIDTNVLLHDPNAIYKFKEHQVLIPIVVVEEIDKFKRDQSDLGRNARTISRYLDAERKKGNLSNGVPLEGGGRLRVVMNSEDIHIAHPFMAASKTNDNWILGVAVHFAKDADHRCVLVTKDVNLRIKADALGIEAEDYHNDKVQIDELYSGWIDFPAPAEMLSRLEETGSIDLPKEGLYANLFLRMINEDDPQHTVVGRVTPKRDRVELLNDQSRNVWGIAPLNLEQRLALELLLDPEIKLVSLVGKAGTGKTLIALAAGLQMVIDEEKYNRLIVSRPVSPLGKDLGFLPGDVDDKIRPWMQPIFDNLEYILHRNPDELSKNQITYQYFIDKGWLQVEPLTFMRGRSIPNQYLLVDEAQNLTPHEIKSIITRAGHGTKVVLTGDPHQIDHPFLDGSTNGINYLVQRFKNQGIYGHVTLSKGERSELAEKASDLL